MNYCGASLPTNKENPEKIPREQTIAKRKQTEEALKQSELRYRQLFSSMTEMFQVIELIFDKDGKAIDYYYRDVNPAFEKLVKKRREQLIDKRVKAVFGIVEDYWLEAYNRVAKTGNPIRFENYGAELEKWYDVYVWKANDKQVAITFADITDRKKAEEAVRRSEEKYRQIVETAEEGIWTAKPDGTTIYVNQKMADMIGYSPEEIVGKIGTEFLARGQESLVLQTRKELDRNARHQREFQFLRKDGTSIWTIANTAPIFECGKHIANIAMHSNITERKEAEEALKASEEKYRQLFNSIDQGFCIIEVVFDTKCKPTDYRFLEVNSLFEQQTGLHNAVGKLIRSLVPTHEEHWFRIYGEVALSGKPMRFEDEAKAMNRYYDVYAFPLGKKKPYQVGILFKDIAERKKAEETLKENEQLYHTVFDNSQDGFQLIELVYDKHGKPIDHKFLKVNQAYELIIGVKADDILDKTAKYISPNQELHWLEVPDRVAKTGVSEHLELYNKDIGKWLDCFYFRYSKNVVGTLFRDITVRKKLEKQLQDSERLAGIGATAGMVGHDIRNPLQAITSDVYLAKTELASTPDSEEKNNALESMDEIEKNIDYINKIVQDLQDYARPLSPKIEESDLKSIVEAFISKNGLPKNIKVNVKITDDAKKDKS